jgi:hypothetical protein
VAPDTDAREGCSFEDEVNDGEFIDCGNVSSDQRIKPINGNVRAARHVVCVQTLWLAIELLRCTMSPELAEYLAPDL